MIKRIVVGTNQLNHASKFYDDILALMGMQRVWEIENGVGWAPYSNSPTFALFSPFNKSAATPGNGSMVAFKAADRNQVDLVHSKALKLGGTDEGKPGERGSGFYAAYFRDLDANKVCICHVDLNDNDTEQTEIE